MHLQIPLIVIVCLFISTRGAPLEVNDDEVETTETTSGFRYHIRPLMGWLKKTAKNTLTIVKSMGKEIATKAAEELKGTLKTYKSRYLQPLRASKPQQPPVLEDSEVSEDTEATEANEISD